MTVELSLYEQKIYSQNGEDGVTLEIIKRIYGNDLYNKYYVEFGVQDGKECNTRIIREKFNWNGLMMDASYENKDINLQKEYVTKENIVNLLTKYEVPKHFNLLSIDIDYNDFYILHEIVKSYSMDIVIVEYNASLVPFIDGVVKYNPNNGWDGSNYFGASLCAYTNLMNKYDYSLVYTENKGVNAFYVNNKILSSSNKNLFLNLNNIDALYNSPKYSNGPLGGSTQDNLCRRYLTSDSIINIS